MSSVDASGDTRTGSPPVKAGELRLEVVVVPVSDVDRARRFYEAEARADLIERGVEVRETFHDGTGVFHHAGTDGRLSGPAPAHADYGTFAAFRDPDGNGWLLQEIKKRLPGR